MPPREACEENHQNLHRCEQDQQNAQAQQIQQPQQLQQPQQPLEQRRRIMIGNLELDDREEHVILAIARRLLAAERGEV